MIIGLSGYGRSGKDSFAQAMVEYGDYTRYAFADGVRELALAIDPYVPTLTPNAPPHRLHNVVNGCGWDIAKDTYPEVRRLLQEVGTQARNIIDKDVWINRTFCQIYDAIAPRDTAYNAVIADVRFPNEAEAIVQEFGGKVIRIERPGVGPANDHASEIAMDGWDWDGVIVNDGTVAQLRAQAIGFTKALTDHPTTESN
jgi:hypothetical protein